MAGGGGLCESGWRDMIHVHMHHAQCGAVLDLAAGRPEETD